MCNWFASRRRPAPPPSQRFITLHSNGIHGRIDGLARTATLVGRIRAEHHDQCVLY